MLAGRIVSRLSAQSGSKRNLISRVRLMSSNQELSQEVGRLIRNARAFCFDVDSTVITKEGIDELAAFKGVGKEVADLTSQ